MSPPNKKTLLFYPGHQGPQAQLRFRGGGRAMAFERNQVREVPAPQAQDALRLSGFHEALRFSEIAERFEISTAVIEALAAGAALKTAPYFAEGAEPIPVVILDPATHRTLRVLQSAQGSIHFSPKKGKAK